MSSESSVRIEISKDQLERLESELSEIRNGFKRALTSAINKTVTSVASHIRRRVASEMKIKVKGLKRHIKPIKGNWDNPSGTVRILNLNVKIAYTGAEPQIGRQYPLTATGEARSLPNRPFKATLGSSKNKATGEQQGGHSGYFVRNFKRRLPISEIYMPSPRQFWDKTPAIQNEEMANASEVLSKNINSQIDRLLKRKKGEAAGESESPGSDE